ncbi:hypothetical protein BJ912DRAFT_1146942 [Pholiota molesta]|nr:hypothetical protein BJ912DRAFT_1146942 [Pholiota molesta]
MATSFAAYASQYLTKHGTDTVDSDQPLFFSFTTDDGSRHPHDTHVEDLDDPHLNPAHDDDPYLKLDDSPRGWLAHLSHSPRRSRSRSRSPSRSPSPQSQSSADTAPPPELLAAPLRPSARPSPARPPPVSELTESLLPRAGTDVFSLPDPRHIPRKRRKHHDAHWTALWLGAVSLSLLLCVILLFTTKRPRDFPAALLPYAILLRTVPVLTLLTLLSAAAAYAHVYLLRVFAGPVMLATSVFVPATLFVSAIWAFVGSFMWDGDVEPTWGETVGLRLFAIIPLVLSLITARRLLHLPRHIHRTSSTLALATHLLMANPFLAALSPALLLAMLLASLPFLTAVFRLLLIGAHWGIALVLAVWLWTWAVVRGVLRMTAAGVVGAWYFADPSSPPAPPMSTHTIHAALTRATGPSLGTLTLSALLLTFLRCCTLSLLLLNRLPPLLLAIPFASYGVPGTSFGLGVVGAGVARFVVPGVEWVVRWVRGWEGRVSRYAVVYCGMVGVGFWEGAGRAGVLVAGRALAEREGREQAGGGRIGRRGRVGEGRGAVVVDFGAEPSLDLLTISPLTLTLPFALATYLFVAHTLGAPHEALGVALLAGATTAVVGVFCVGVVRDCADTLYLCYCIDKAAGERHREEVFIAFEYDAAAEPAFGIGAGLPGSVVLPMHRQQHGASGGGGAGYSISSNSNNNNSSARAVGQRRRYGRGRGRGGPGDDRTALAARGGSRTRRRGAKETLFDALAEAQAGGPATRRAPPQALKVPLASYLDSENESLDGGDERTPVHAPPLPAAAAPQDAEDEDDEMNPFRRSALDDDEEAEAVVRHPIPIGGRTGGRAAGGGAPVYAFAGSPGGAGGGSPASAARAGFGFVGGGGHRRAASGAGAVVVELNMKSQFLMNMRAFGAESEASASAVSGASEGGSAAGVGCVWGGEPCVWIG